MHFQEEKKKLNPMFWTRTDLIKSGFSLSNVIEGLARTEFF